ncbi:MAG: hypothetical protein GY800_10565 [Planctomycetes bacterium]|nr:hypothetical protein [Planctomycetota bacterium]
MKDITEVELQALYKYIHEEIPQENYHAVDSDDEFRELYGHQGIYALFASGLPCLYDANRRLILFPSLEYLSRAGKLNYSWVLVAVAHEVGHLISHRDSKKARELIENAPGINVEAARKEVEDLAHHEADRLLKKLGLTDDYCQIRERLKKKKKRRLF